MAAVKKSAGHTTIRDGNLFCLNCGGEQIILMSMRIPILDAVIKAFNKMHKSCKKTWTEPFADKSLSEKERAKWWLKNGRRDTSSETMFYICYQKNTEGKRLEHPHDPSDFFRCYKLVETVPEIKGKLYLLSDFSPGWAKIIENWDKLTGMLEEQIRTKKYNGEMYDFMKSLGC